MSINEKISSDICIANLRKEALNKHVVTVHEEKKEFKCAICNAEFTSKHMMNSHITTIHEGKKQFQCDICNMNFGLKSVP